MEFSLHGRRFLHFWRIPVTFTDIMNSCSPFFTFSVVWLIYFRALERCTENDKFSFGVAAFMSFCNSFSNLDIGYCVFIYSGRGGKVNSDIIAGLLSSKAGFLCYGVVKSPYLNYKWVHCYAATSCYYLGRKKKQ